MAKKIALLLIIGLLLVSAPAQAEKPGRTYFEIEDHYFRHLITAGDTFYNLARKFNTNPTKLQELNPALEARDLQIGTEVKLNISNELDYYIVNPNDTLWDISRGLGIEIADIIAANNLTNPDYIQPNEVLLLPEGAVVAEDQNIKLTEVDQSETVITVSGLTRSFEASLNYALETENGKVLQEGFTTASIAGPHWGIFGIEVTDVPANADHLTIFTVSMKDGSRQDEVKIDLH
jgi:LysM repeat protein